MSVPPEFFRLQESLPRQGPGDRASLDWALSRVPPRNGARICDAGCGGGADIEGLLHWSHGGRVLAVDTHAPFVAVVSARFSSDSRVEARTMDMAEVEGPFDLIWCAGALYFMGLEKGLQVFLQKLSPQGALVFSYPAFFAAEPSPAARAFWGDEVALVQSASDLGRKVRESGFDLIEARPLPDAAWEAYYGPMEARIAELMPRADEAMRAVLDEAVAEIEGWRGARSDTGYLQVVAVRP